MPEQTPLGPDAFNTIVNQLSSIQASLDELKSQKGDSKRVNSGGEHFVALRAVAAFVAVGYMAYQAFNDYLGYLEKKEERKLDKVA